MWQQVLFGKNKKKVVGYGEIPNKSFKSVSDICLICTDLLDFCPSRGTERLAF